MKDNYNNNNNGQSELFSEKIKAGKRTYFFDVKSTRSNDYFITITESKKRIGFDEEGVSYEKHKIFLYKEDFHKFLEALTKTVNHIKTELMPEVDFAALEQPRKDSSSDSELKWDN